MKTWFTVKASADDSIAEVTIFDEIGFWGVTARQFVEQFRAIKQNDVRLVINSPGGNVMEALAIFNAIVASGKNVTGKVMGVAASAASYILMACNRIEMPANTFLWVHNPEGMVYGNADEMEAAASDLRKMQESLTATYAKRWKGKPEALLDALKAETLFTAAECLANGFADEVLPEMIVTASFDLDRQLPAPVQALFRKATPPDTPLAEQIVALATEAGLSEFGATFAVTCASVDEARRAIEAAREVRALCTVMKLPDSEFADFVNARLPLPEVRAAINAKRLATAAQNIDTSPPATPPASRAAQGPRYTAQWAQVLGVTLPANN